MYAHTCGPGTGLIPYIVSTVEPYDRASSTVVLGYAWSGPPRAYISSHRSAALAGRKALMAGGRDDHSMDFEDTVVMVEGGGETTRWTLSAHAVTTTPEDVEGEDGELYHVARRLLIEFRATLETVTEDDVEF